MFVVIALVLICVAMSTRQTRAEGRELVKPYGQIVGVITALVIFLLLIPWDRL